MGGGEKERERGGGGQRKAKHQSTALRTPTLWRHVPEIDGDVLHRADGRRPDSYGFEALVVVQVGAVDGADYAPDALLEVHIVDDAPGHLGPFR